MKKQLDTLLKLCGAALLLLIGITLFNRATSQDVNLHLPKSEKIQWDFTPRKIGGWALMAGAGYAHGLEDAYYADPHVFENAGIKGQFFAHDAWKNNYERTADGGLGRHKPQLGNTFRDVKHALSFVQSRFLIGGVFVLGTSPNQKLKHKALDVGIGMLAYSLAAQQAYNIRHQ